MTEAIHRTGDGRIASPDASADTLSKDEIFHVLRNRRRRYALHYLKRHPETAEIGELADHVTAWENGKSVEAITSQERKRVYNSLQQTHLPELSDTGLVEYEAARGRVELTDRAGRLDVYMEVVHGREIPWHEYYVALGALSTALMAAVWIDAFPFTLLPDLAWGVFVAVSLTVSALGHHYYHRKVLLGASKKPPEAEREGEL